MQNGVAVRAYWPKVLNGVYFILFAEASQFSKMVNMNHTFSQFTI